MNDFPFMNLSKRAIALKKLSSEKSKRLQFIQ
jgi:hypothetical protein